MVSSSVRVVVIGSAALSDRAYCLIEDDFRTPDEAFAAAHDLVAMRCAADGVEPLTVIGDFVIPPMDGSPSRDFQTLHFDFGLPLDPKVAQDVARYTALYTGRDGADASAITRLVPLVALLGQRCWPRSFELVDRFAAYGRTRGARDDERGYSEGSFARVVDAAATTTPLLPSVKADPDFLCGLEFDTLRAELDFFRRHGLDVEEVAIRHCSSAGTAARL